MKPSFRSRIGLPLLVVGVTIFIVQIAAWVVGYGWLTVKTGALLEPLLSAVAFDHALERRSMRGIGVLVEWLASTHLYLVCLLSGLFLTSLDARAE